MYNYFIRPRDLFYTSAVPLPSIVAEGNNIKSTLDASRSALLAGAAARRAFELVRKIILHRNEAARLADIVTALIAENPNPLNPIDIEERIRAAAMGAENEAHRALSSAIKADAERTAAIQLANAAKTGMSFSANPADAEAAQQASMAISKANTALKRAATAVLGTELAAERARFELAAYRAKLGLPK